MAPVKNHEQMTDGVTARDRDIRRERKKRGGDETGKDGGGDWEKKTSR